MQLLLKHTNPLVLQPQETTRDEAMESMLEELSTWRSRLERPRRSVPLCLLSHKILAGSLAACLPAHWPCMSGYGFGKGHCSHCQFWDLGHVKDGACREGQTTQGRAVSHRHPPPISIGCDSPLVPAQSITGSQEPKGRAPFAQKEATKTRGERQKAKSPLTTSWAL